MGWKNIVADVAPSIAKALLGPGAGHAVGFLAKEMLGDENATEEQVAAAINAASPGDLIRLRELNNEFKLTKSAHALESEKVALQNTASAREMFSVDQKPQAILSYLVVGGFFLVLFGIIGMYAVVGGEVLPNEAHLLLGTLLGALATYVGQIMKFWFGGKPDDREQMDRIYHSIPQTGRQAVGT